MNWLTAIHANEQHLLVIPAKGVEKALYFRVDFTHNCKLLELYSALELLAQLRGLCLGAIGHVLLIGRQVAILHAYPVVVPAAHGTDLGNRFIQQFSFEVRAKETPLK